MIRKGTMRAVKPHAFIARALLDPEESPTVVKHMSSRKVYARFVISTTKKRYVARVLLGNFVSTVSVRTPIDPAIGPLVSVYRHLRRFILCESAVTTFASSANR